MKIVKFSVAYSLASFVMVSAAFAQSGFHQLPAASPAEVGMSAVKLKQVDVVMNDQVAEKLIAGGVVIIARRGKVFHHKAYGKRDLEAELPMQTDTIFRIYSMTKSIVTAAALMLCEEGKLTVADPVSKFIPALQDIRLAGKVGTKPVTSQMTIADLMRHTAGYGYGWGNNQPFNEAFREINPVGNPAVSLEEMTAKLDKLPLLFEPGTDWAYGISTDLLGRVIEVVSGQSLSEFLKQRIFTPLDMNDTGFYVPADKAHRFAKAYSSDGKGNLSTWNEDDHWYSEPPRFEHGGGGLVSTAENYMRFLLMIQADGLFQGRRLLKSETVALMKTNQLPKTVGWIKFGDQIRTGVGFGYGFSVRVQMSDWDPGGRLGEYGWGGKASTHYWTWPKDELTVITMEQIVPYSFMTEFRLKGPIHGAINDR